MIFLKKDHEDYIHRKKSIILPFEGEFGGYVSLFIKEVDLLKTNYEKIVCCRAGEECLFPSAQGFFYDWEPSISDREKNAFIKNVISEETINKIKNKILQTVNKEINPIVDFHYLGGFCPYWPYYKNKKVKWFTLPIFKHFFPLSPTNCKTPDIDICIAARKREAASFRNYSNWDKVADWLTRRKMEVAILGKKETTQQMNNVSCYSYNYGGVNACVELLRKAKLFITTDTGLAHLNNFIETPMLILPVPGWKGEPEMLSINKNTRIFYASDDCWKNTSTFFSYIYEVCRILDIPRRINTGNRNKNNKARLRKHPKIETTQ